MSDSALISRARSRQRQCPHCESVYVTRSRRQGVWNLPLVRLLRIHIFRCTECWRRFHGLGSY
jgi:hypothetical protein